MDAVGQPQPTVMATSFIRQQVDMGINELLYQVSTQVANIIKSMVHNKVHNVKEQEKKQANMGESSANSMVAGKRGQTNDCQGAFMGPSKQMQPVTMP